MRLLLTWILLGCALLLGQVGCTTSSNTVAYKTTASIVTTVDAAMHGWAKYVVTTRQKMINAGDESGLKSLYDSEQKVREAYGIYVDAAKAAIAAGASISTNIKDGTDQQATQMIIDASTPLLSLIANLLGSK